ncbi:hypothetical protein D3C71_1597250 [compost metagenome]
MIESCAPLPFTRKRVGTLTNTVSAELNVELIPHWIPTLQFSRVTPVNVARELLVTQMPVPSGLAGWLTMST